MNGHGDVDGLLRALVPIGRTESFDRLSEFPEFQNRESILPLADVPREKFVSFARGLSLDDQVAFVKSVAMIEERAGGFGSVTNLVQLLPIVPDPDRDLFDWILRHYSRYYYSKGAKTIEAYDHACQREAVRRAASAKREHERREVHRLRIAQTATHNLFNAVRRGDLNAVCALIERGADVNARTSDGTSLLAFAVSKGNETIVSTLQKAREK